jgi:hypothetical protein
MVASNIDWPRDGAMLKGEVVEAKGEKWLLVSEVKHSGGTVVAQWWHGLGQGAGGCGNAIRIR